MKVYFIIALAVLLNIYGVVFAGSVDYVTNQSVPFLRTLSRNAATDETDIIVYNPAGTTQFADGLYMSFHWQGFSKDYAIRDVRSGREFKTTLASPFIPSFFVLQKEDRLAGFFAFTIPAGGGSVEYDDGLYMVSSMGLTDGYFKGTSLYYGATAGIAYQIDETLSFSMAVRGIHSTKEYLGNAEHPLAGTLELDSEKKAEGTGGILGVNLNIGNGNIGVRYETQTTLKYTTKTKVNDFSLPQFDDGLIEYRDLPAQLSFGCSVDLTEQFKASFGMNYFFLHKAAQNNEAYANYDDGIEIQLGGEYKLNNKWLFSAGYNYVEIGGNKDTYTDFEYQLDAHFVGAGFRFTPTDKLHINFAVAKPFYQSSKGAGTFENAEYSKDVNIIAVGVEYKLF